MDSFSVAGIGFIERAVFGISFELQFVGTSLVVTPFGASDFLSIFIITSLELSFRSVVNCLFDVINQFNFFIRYDFNAAQQIFS